MNFFIKTGFWEKARKAPKEWLNLNNYFMEKLVNIKTITENYTLTASDNNKLIEANSGSAIAITIPPDTFPVGTQMLVQGLGTGQVTFVAGTGVTILSKDGNLTLSAQYSGASLVQRAENIWYLTGDLSA